MFLWHWRHMTLEYNWYRFKNKKKMFYISRAQTAWNRVKQGHTCNKTQELVICTFILLIKTHYWVQKSSPYVFVFSPLLIYSLFINSKRSSYFFIAPNCTSGNGSPFVKAIPYFSQMKHDVCCFASNREHLDMFECYSKHLVHIIF